MQHPTFCHGIHPSSSLFSGDGATWQGHVSQSISTLSSTGISTCRSALPSRLGVVCLWKTCLCARVCVCVTVTCGLRLSWPLSSHPPVSTKAIVMVRHCHLTSPMTITVSWRWKMADSANQSHVTFLIIDEMAWLVFSADAGKLYLLSAQPCQYCPPLKQQIPSSMVSTWSIICWTSQHPLNKTVLLLYFFNVPLQIRWNWNLFWIVLLTDPEHVRIWCQTTVPTGVNQTKINKKTNCPLNC